MLIAVPAVLVVAETKVGAVGVGGEVGVGEVVGGAAFTVNVTDELDPS